MEDQLIKLIQTVGLPIALVIFFVIKEARRERRNDEKFTALEDFCRTELLSVSKNAVEMNNTCAKVIADRNIRSEKIEKVIEENTRVVADFKNFLISRKE